MMSGQSCKEEEENKNSLNAAGVVPNGRLGTNSLLQRSKVGSHGIQRNTTLFQKYIRFLETASIDWKDSEKNTIIEMMKHRFEKADPSYLSSKDFEHLLMSTISDTKKDVNCSFVCIKVVIEELKSYKLKSHSAVGVSIPHKDSAYSPSSKNKVSSLFNVSEPCSSPFSSSVTTARSSPEVICVDSEDEVSTVNSFAIAGNAQLEPKESHLCNLNHCEMRRDTKNHSNTLACAKDVCWSSADGNVQQTTVSNGIKQQTPEEALEGNPRSNSTLSQKKVKHIKKLEKLMEKIDRKIKKLQQKELTLEDMDEESNYILEDKFKKKFVKVWEEWCKQIGRSSKAGYETQKPFHYEGSRYISINVAVEKFMNKRKVFPDFCDILDVVTTENTKSNLCLTETQCHSIARDIFSDVGKKLKERRCRDYAALSGCYLTDNLNLADDPADCDEKLRQKLDNNRKESEEKLDMLLESYVQMQEEKTDVQEDAAASLDEDNDEDEVCSKADDEEISSCNSDESNCDEVLPDSLKMKKVSPFVIPQNTGTEASMGKNPCTPDSKTKSLSDVTCTSSSYTDSKSFNSNEASTFQLVKQTNIAPKKATKLKNAVDVKTSSVNPRTFMSSVFKLSSATGSQNYSKVPNSSRTKKEVRENSLDCSKTKLKSVSLGNCVSNLPQQNECKHSVDNSVTEVHSVNESVMNSLKTSSSATDLQNNCQSITNSSHCMKTEFPSINLSKQMSGNAVNGPSGAAEEIWIVSSSDSDASTEPTSDVKAKFSSNSKSISHQPCFSVSRTPKQPSGKCKNFCESSNSNNPSALKTGKRNSSRQNHIPDKKLCLSFDSRS